MCCGTLADLHNSLIKASQQKWQNTHQHSYAYSVMPSTIQIGFTDEDTVQTWAIEMQLLQGIEALVSWKLAKGDYKMFIM